MESLLLDPHWVYYALSALVVASGIVVAVTKAVLKAIRAMRKKAQEIEKTIICIEKISKEFSPNGGSSIKDQLNAMQRDLKRNTDLTEQVLHRQRWMLNHKDHAIFEADDDGKTTWVNATYLKLIGRDMNFVMGHGWKNIIAPEDRDRVVKNWERCIKDKTNAEDTYLVVDAEGKKVKVFCAACRIENVGYIGALEIISSTKDNGHTSRTTAK